MLKGAFYAWVGSRYSLERALAIRVIVGNATLYPLIGVSALAAKLVILWMRKHRPTLPA